MRGAWPWPELLQKHQRFDPAIPLAGVNPPDTPAQAGKSHTHKVIPRSTVGKGARMPHNGGLGGCGKGQGGCLRTHVDRECAQEEMGGTEQGVE